MSIFNGFFDNFLNGVQNPKGNLGDYQHAARLYIDNNMRLAPKFKHLYHVVLNINPNVIGNTLFTYKSEINILARSADLPRYRVQTQTVNQYNRKKIVQTSVQYQPVTIEFHDDNAGLTSLLWENYFRYYYVDSNYTKREADGTPSTTVPAYLKSVNGINPVYWDISAQRYRFGLDKPNKLYPFFDSIQIYQLHPRNARSSYTCFTLINPYIDNFEHDAVSQENSEFSINRLSVSYESVQYTRGYVEVGNVPQNFAEAHYDKTPSPLSTAGGGTTSLFGRGGVIAGLNNTVESFAEGNFIAGLINGANTLDNYRNLSKAGLRQESSGILEATLSNAIGNLLFPKKPTSNQVTEARPKRF